MNRTVDRRFILTSLSAVALAAALPARVRAADKLKPGSDAALIVVDVQNCFVTGGTLPVKEGEAVVPVINKLAEDRKSVV